MKTLSVKFLFVLLLAALAVFILTKYQTVPLDSRPHDFASARNLAKSVADKANCGDFEDNSFQQDVIFTCQIGGRMFAIYVFYDKEARNGTETRLRAENNRSAFKRGEYYFISKALPYSEDPLNQPYVHAQDLDGFPGELIAP